MNIIYPDKYFSQINEKFPELSETQVKNIIYYGLRALFILCCYGVDIKCQQNTFFAYFGHIFAQPDRYIKYRKIKLAAKYRVLYSREKVPYSGKYYFVLSEDMHKKMPKRKKGGKFPMSSIMAYKIIDEAKLQCGTYLYEIDWPVEGRYKMLINTNDIKSYKCLAKRSGFRTFEPLCAEYKDRPFKRSYKKRIQ